MTCRVIQNTGTMNFPSYIGRFAPSPTGPLHFGSLVTALASYLDALVHNGQWLLRIEDLDPPREVPGAAQHIIHTLKAFGFHWHGAVVYQSQRSAAYQSALEQLQAQGLIYPCTCSRRVVTQQAQRLSADGEPVYSGRCAVRGTSSGKNTNENLSALNMLASSNAAPSDAPRHSWRLRMPNKTLHFHDRWLGPQQENPAFETGDIVLKRADTHWAYHLAVVVDDIAAGVTHIVRGDDLLHSTARQKVVYETLAAPCPRYLHLPVVRNTQGEKLSKQTGAPAVDSTAALTELQQALHYLTRTELAAPTLQQFWMGAPAVWEKFINAHPSFPEFFAAAGSGNIR